MSPGTSPCWGIGVAILVAACDQASPELVVDAPADAHQAAVDANLCYGSGIVTACLSAPPIQPVVFSIGTTLVDTDDVSNCTQVVAQPRSGPEVCVIAGTTVTVSNTVIATGGRPLVLIGADTVTINGTIDVSSKASPRRIGAGGSQGPCSDPGLADADGHGGGGGAGGSLGTRGGDGGTGDQTMMGLNHTAAKGGTAGDPQAMPGFLRGGCAGEHGGASGFGNGAQGGDGGGAVYLIAGHKITITGDVFASGAGGGANFEGNGEQQGGGGGGSGGLIGLESPAIEIARASLVVANGGGGGGGGGPDSGGFAGDDGTTAAWNTRALGGYGGIGFFVMCVVPRGALGSAVEGDGMTGPPSDCGGGGGGGGLGLLWIDGAMTGGATMLSPPPTIAP